MVVRPRHRKGTLDRGKSRDTSIPEAEAAVVKEGERSVAGAAEVAIHVGNRETCFTSTGGSEKEFSPRRNCLRRQFTVPAGQFFGSISFFLFFFFCICSACHRRRFTELYFRDSRHPTPLVNHWPCQGHVRRGWAKPASCLFECFFERNANKGLQIPPIIEGTTSQSVVVNACEKIVSHNQSQVSQWNFVVWNYLEQRLTYIIYTDMGIVFILQPVVRENNTGNDGKKQRNKVSSKGNKVIEFWFTKSRETCVTVFDA